MVLTEKGKKALRNAIGPDSHAWAERLAELTGDPVEDIERDTLKAWAEYACDSARHNYATFEAEVLCGGTFVELRMEPECFEVHMIEHVFEDFDDDMTDAEWRALDEAMYAHFQNIPSDCDCWLGSLFSWAQGDDSLKDACYGHWFEPYPNWLNKPRMEVLESICEMADKELAAA